MEENKKKTWDLVIKDLINGRFLTEKFMSKHLKLLVLIVGLIIIFISNGYSCNKKLAEIEALNARLKDVKYENKVLTTKWTSSSRQSQVKALLEQKGMNLSSPTSPAFEIHK